MSIYNQFMPPRKFSDLVESLVANKGMGYLDAITHLCEKHSIRDDRVPELLTTTVKEKLRDEAMALNLLKKSDNGRIPYKDRS